MKRILITGATSGIGKALCLLYQKQGYAVIACGRNQQALDELRSLKNVSTLSFDISDKEQVEEALRTLPELDMVILNAGSCEYIDNAKNFDGDLFARVITTNLIALGYCLQSVLPKIKKGGQLALMGSSAIYLPFSRAEAYGASKAGVAYLAKTLAIDLIDDQISVCLINPGFVKTPLTDKNAFSMPMLITADKAADYIFKGLLKGKKEIHFPAFFTFTLKILAFFPDAVWFFIATRMINK
ncbi:short-chain dehydrogenase/reductase SDR [Psychromonas ingrahamii 37]|uniref:Short-chain dehydrogenase/reductase SDR n=1 Tax=Psychromonas ingrahamii (strain DSM 17664 / CCUG 51855 / 37) TaxID=357804 RepID=A1STM4_PSYIN|nr:SDR family NAD(P)-dependent oxidoreductase [Psychromonas ingrahamii]ABM02839.1 short-chain dehydrogenase/reductase SDR [Psychromonas ingrahamii 37]